MSPTAAIWGRESAGPLLDWLGAAQRRRIFVVHGEYERGMRKFQEVLEARGYDCHLPGMGESIKID